MKRLDPRLYQILFLGLLLTTGVVFRDFTIRPLQIALTFAAGLLTQRFFVRRLGLQNVNPLSAVVTCFGLSILLRADNHWVHPAAAVAAIGAKFLVRVRGKHVFNPANLGVMLALLLLPGAWVSPGQWGQDLAVAGWVFMLGAIVVNRARRMDISWVFIAVYLGLVGLRVLWLGQNPAVWLHQLKSGSLLLFTFFMISDPMTIPNRAAARVLYASLVAGLAFVWQYGLFMTSGPVWSLFLLSPLVPLLDLAWPSPKYVWNPKGGNNEKEELVPVRGPAAVGRAASCAGA